MELILNEFSLNGQFNSNEEFTQYIIDILVPVLEVIEEKQIPLLRKSTMFNCQVTKEQQLQDFLKRANDPAISILKKYIINLAFCEPYWDLDAESLSNVKYEYPVKADNPNCFTEAIERNAGLVSIRNNEFKENCFICKKDNEIISICNITTLECLLVEYLKENRDGIKYVLEKYPFERTVLLADVKGKCYAEEALLQNGLDSNDYNSIIDSIPKLIEALSNGHKSTLWDKLKDDIFELRIHISGERIFRLLFIQDSGLIFLNGFVKKTQKTPSQEIEKAIKISKMIVKRCG